jgi:hypothetical protein
MLNIVILSLTMIYLSVATSYTSYTRSLSNMPPLLVCSNTWLKRGGNLKYHTTTTTITNKRDMSIITKMGMSDGYLNNLNFPQYVNTNLSSLNLTKSDYYKNIPNTGDNISISSIYLNIDKMNGVYFSKDVKNVIFTFPENLSELYYYDGDNNNSKGTIYKISNNTRINMKNLKRFVFQSFNNNIDGIVF